MYKIELEMNTSILPIINVGMYGTRLDLNNIKDGYIQEYKDIVKDEAVKYIKDVLSLLPWKLTVKEAKIYSPTYYNYSNDELYFVMELELKDLFEIYERVKNNSKFMKWIAETYVSYSGFTSLMPTDKNKYWEAIRGQDLERAVAMYFMWKFRDVNLNKYQEDFVYDVLENTGYMTEDFEEESEE